MTLKYATLCSGIEGFGLGFDRAGAECVYQCEIDKQARSVLARHYPNVERSEDVNDARTESDLVRLRPDLLAFGFPCQDLSVAGRRAGLAGERSGLFFRCADIVRACRPRWLCIENVPGLLSSWSGDTPSSMGVDAGPGRTMDLDETSDLSTVLHAVSELGYGWAYRVYDAQWFGVAQRRFRVFIVGCLGDVRRPGEILFEPDCLPWDSPPSREARPGIANGPASCLKSSGKYDHVGDESKLVSVDMTNGLLTKDLAGTVTCELRKGDRGQGVLDIAHTLRAEGFDASEDGTGRGTPLVPATFMASDYKNGEFESAELARPLTTSADRTRAAPIVAFDCKATDAQPGDVMPTLRSMNHDKSHASGGGQAAATTRSGVRRLTPRECERLQGFPDDWTRYAADGTEIADGPRYRMLGNAVCVNVSEWIARRIVGAKEQLGSA